MPRHLGPGGGGGLSCLGIWVPPDPKWGGGGGGGGGDTYACDTGTQRTTSGHIIGAGISQMSKKNIIE